MSLLSINEASSELGLNPSRVRSLVASGELPGMMVGNRWVIDSVDVARRRQSPRPAGRPLAPANAWGALFMASALEAPWLSSNARWRVKRSLAVEGLAGLRPRLVRRAELHRFLAHPGELRHLGARPDLVNSGISAAGAHNLDLLSDHEIDAYIRADGLAEVQRAHVLEPAMLGEGNVLLRVVPASAWHFAEGQVAPIAAVAVDLSEEADSRSARTGREAIKRLDGKVRRSR